MSPQSGRNLVGRDCFYLPPGDGHLLYVKNKTKQNKLFHALKLPLIFSTIFPPSGHPDYISTRDRASLPGIISNHHRILHGSCSLTLLACTLQAALAPCSKRICVSLPGPFSFVSHDVILSGQCLS